MNDDFNKKFEESHTYYYTAESMSDVGGSPQPSGEDPAAHKAGLVSMILGLIALFTWSCCCANFVLGIISICFAAKAKRLSENKKMNGMGVAGMTCSIISMGITICCFGLVILVSILPA